MADHLSSVAPFEINGVKFACWVVDDGQRYVWRSTCERYAAGRIRDAHWCRRDGEVVGTEYRTLKMAMAAATADRMEQAA